MLLITIILIVLLQIGAYRFARRVNMNYPFLKVLVVFLVLDFSVYPYLLDLSAPQKRLPGYELDNPEFIFRCWILGFVIVMITHLTCYLNHKARLKKTERPPDPPIE